MPRFTERNAWAQAGSDIILILRDKYAPAKLSIWRRVSIARGAALNRKERVDRALEGRDVDRPPFSFWHHFGLKTAEDHARATLDFHRQYRTDFVKVMSDFAYPRPAGKWFELKVEPNPFPEQIRALELIKNGLDGQTYFVETLFNPFNVAEKLSSPEEVRRLKNEKPQALLDALDVITQSEIHHAKRALETGAAGILLAVANANSLAMTRDDYVRFSAPFDRRILDAVRAARLNILHLHTDPQQLFALPRLSRGRDQLFPSRDGNSHQ